MKTPLAIYNLWHQGAKTLVSIGGVAFALLLVFMQLGFKGAVESTATNVLERLQCDIVLRSPDYVHLYEAGKFDRDWLNVARGTPGVLDAKPFWVTIDNWRTLPTSLQVQEQQNSDDNSIALQYLPIAVMAFSTSDVVFDLPDVEQQLSVLRSDDQLLIDDSTQRDYGPWNGKSFSEDDVEMQRNTELHQKSFRIAGTYDLGTGLAANGAVIVGEAGFNRIWPFGTRSYTSLGLIEVEDSTPAAVQRVVQALQQRVSASTTAGPAPVVVSSGGSFWSRVRRALDLPEPIVSQGAVEVMSLAEAKQRETYRWLWQMPIGLIFQLGVFLALIVGAAIVYMILSTDVANRLPEYATLLAMGYSRLFLASIVMTQAIVLCGLGFAAAWGVSEVLYRVTSAFSGIPLEMDAARVILVSVLGLVMCCASGLLALRKLWKAEPATLF